jgi:hypothetical protein
MHIVFILQYEKVQNNNQIFWKIAETNVVPNLFTGVIFGCQPFLSVAQQESGTMYQKSYILVSDHI